MTESKNEPCTFCWPDFSEDCEGCEQHSASQKRIKELENDLRYIGDKHWAGTHFNGVDSGEVVRLREIFKSVEKK